MNKLQALGADAYLTPYRGDIERRQARVALTAARLAAAAGGTLADAARNHEYFGLHATPEGWVFREYAPNAVKVVLVGEFSNWREFDDYALTRLEAGGGVWQITLPPGTFRHLSYYRLQIYWPGGTGSRLPAYARYVTQDRQSGIFSAQVWAPETPYLFQHPSPPKPEALLVYEAHIGMAQEEPKIGSFDEFREKTLPRIVKAGYNTLQLMAIMSHPYYGSFGYHVANFFAVSSRFGTPDDFKKLVDAAHGAGLRVIIDLVHSHAVRNETEGLGRFDGTTELYFSGVHEAWDSYCFDYEKPEVLRFLLSDCRYFLEEYRLDGFRFDGVTSMLYHHHGLGRCFTGYGDYFSAEVNDAAATYLALANQVIHAVRPDAVTVAEDVSGMPGLGAPVAAGGLGFDYRLAMGVTDYWFKLFDLPDESWNMHRLFYELNNRRRDERTISYVECHDQAIVGGQTAIFRLAGNDMYTKMRRCDTSPAVERAVAIHKLARLATAATGSFGYMNFMGNEFGHPEWIDFPREGNQWSLHYARRQWRLADDAGLFYHALGEFDRNFIHLLHRHGIWREEVRRLKLSDDDKIMAFERGGLWFFMNFHPTASYPDYGIEVLPGEYEWQLDSDAERFGGFGRVVAGQHYFTNPERDGNILKHMLKLYLPSRTALVLKRRA